MDALSLLAFALVPLAAARLTRFVTTDSLGEWLVAAPARRWAIPHESRALAAFDLEERARADAERTRTHSAADLNRLESLAASYERSLQRREREADADGPFSWQARLVQGLECPFCVGFWLGLALLVATTLIVILAPGGALIAWTVLLGALGMNYIVAHVGSRIDAPE